LPPTLSIRAATPEDVKRLAPLFVAYRKFYKLAPRTRDSAKFLGERMTRGEAHVFIAEVGERGAAGFALVYPTFSSLRLAPAWTLNDLFVTPRHRRLGVARALLREIARVARARKVAVVSLATHQTNARAKALYESEGYVEDIGFAHYDLTVPPRRGRSGR
jgi:ribosomal protein S18 acetylase RimI-like enzyme